MHYGFKFYSNLFLFTKWFEGEPDVTGHLYGPNSVEIEHVVKELDYVLDNLMRKLETEKFYDIKNEIDILIVTDHGE